MSHPEIYNRLTNNQESLEGKMKENNNKGKGRVSRREFMGISGAAIAGASIAPVTFAAAESKKEIRVMININRAATGGCLYKWRGHFFCYEKAINE